MRVRRWKVLLPLFVLVAAVSVVAAAAASDSRGSAVIVPSPAFTPAQLASTPAADWITAGGGLTDQRYTSLNQINTTNGSQLQVAWQAHMGIPAKTQKKISEEGSVVAYGGTLFATDGNSGVYALDGATGASLWKYAPVFAHKIGFGLFVNRGLGLGAGNVYEGILDGSVVALNQQTGAVVWRNQVSDSSKGYSFTAAPVYYNGTVIIGVSGGDAGARGYAIALNAATGQEIWRWYVTPAPGEPGSETWPKNNEWKHGGALWIYPSIDPGLGLVYIVTGNPVPWNTRGPGADLYTDSIVALNVSTGKLAWYFQTVHHDIWDYDVTNPPILFDATINGTLQHGVAVASKTGWVYLLDRATGKPLLGIPEKKVKQVTPKNKLFTLSPTQPFPVGEPFVNQCSTRAQWPAAAPDGKLLKVGCIFQPYGVSSKGSFLASAPSATGGTDWAPSAYNPQTNLMYLCVTDGAGGSLGAETPKEQKLKLGTSYIGDNFGAGSPVLANFGKVVAMNVTTNTMAWQTKWPQPCYSGTMTTAGGLVFAGQSSYSAKKAVKGKTPAGKASVPVLSALDASSGKVLWNSAPMDAGANAPSTTYSINGKQYVVILAGGNALFGSKPGDSIYAYALPG
ncbi:MAG: quinohemoprotein ethanol dehydrogenase [Gaiellales bacterium]|nr:quinohemoprotein ethanol dehydrogenase [Gaiellales bacterium]